MIFVYKKWDSFCYDLTKKGIVSIPAKDVSEQTEHFLVLKHDVETDVAKAFKMSQIEHKYGHKGSYYVQAYLMSDPKNIQMLKQMQDMGHEMSYHYDVMDSCHGDLDKAIAEFEINRRIFENNGFLLKTLCQHGNPVVERVGYTSNRDFFRSERVCEAYPELSDIMVNFKQAHHTDYTYFSDAGRQFKMIYDPITNDIVNSDDKNVIYKDLNAVLNHLSADGKYIISTHPHRWTNSALLYIVKSWIFKVVKFTAKLLVKIPFMKKFMSRYYYLAKKI